MPKKVISQMHDWRVFASKIAKSLINKGHEVVLGLKKRAVIQADQ